MRTELTMKTLGLTALISAIPTLAFGHGGHHGETSLQSALQHLAQSPYHLALLGIAAAVATFGAHLLFRRLIARRDN
ncbi:MAG: hypothetical protein AB8B94_03510 [Hyphomicrobiales bacterium]